MFLAIFSSLVCWIDLLLQMVKWFFSVVTLLTLVTEFSKLKCLVKIRKSGNYPPPLQL